MHLIPLSSLRMRVERPSVSITITCTFSTLYIQYAQHALFTLLQTYPSVM